MNWFVVQTKPRQEGRAVQHLEQQGFNVYFPQLPKTDSLGRHIGQQAMFPGYCFIEDQGGAINTVRSTPGVKNLILFGVNSKPASLTAIELGTIKVAELFHEKTETAISHGEPITVIEGPFKDFNGLYSKKSKERVEVLLSLLGKQQRIFLQPSQIIPAKDH